VSNLNDLAAVSGGIAKPDNAASLLFERHVIPIIFESYFALLACRYFSSSSCQPCALQ
jgi:hypothetical protein